MVNIPRKTNELVVSVEISLSNVGLIKHLYGSPIKREAIAGVAKIIFLSSLNMAKHKELLILSRPEKSLQFFSDCPVANIQISISPEYALLFH